MYYFLVSQACFICCFKLLDTYYKILYFINITSVIQLSTLNMPIKPSEASVCNLALRTLAQFFNNFKISYRIQYSIKHSVNECYMRVCFKL